MVFRVDPVTAKPRLLEIEPVPVSARMSAEEPRAKVTSICPVEVRTIQFPPTGPPGRATAQASLPGPP